MYRTGLILLVLSAAPALLADEPAAVPPIALEAIAEPAPAHSGAHHVVMHKSPGCGCCAIWATHMQAHGFDVESIADPQVQALKDRLGIAPEARSCHTAMLGQYLIEGHVPAGDIIRLLRDKPDDVKGLSVPGMPLGSPGMEHPNPQRYQTIALMKDGSYRVFAEHLPGEDYSPQESKDENNSPEETEEEELD